MTKILPFIFTIISSLVILIYFIKRLEQLRKNKNLAVLFLINFFLLLINDRAVLSTYLLYWIWIFISLIIVWFYHEEVFLDNKHFKKLAKPLASGKDAIKSLIILLAMVGMLGGIMLVIMLDIRSILESILFTFNHALYFWHAYW